MKVKMYSKYLLSLLLVTTVLPSFPVFSVINKAYPTKTSKITAVSLVLMTGAFCWTVSGFWSMLGELQRARRINQTLRDEKSTLCNENRELKDNIEKMKCEDHNLRVIENQSMTIKNLEQSLAELSGGS